MRTKAARRRWRALLSASLLVSSLALSAALALSAWSASRSQRRTIQRELRDETRFGSWTYAVVSGERLRGVMDAAFRPIEPARTARGAGPLPDPADIVAAAPRVDTCDSASESRRFAFRLDLTTRGLTVAGGAPSEAEQARLVETVAGRAANAADPEPAYAFLFDDDAPRGDPVAYTVVHDAAGAPRIVYGVTTCAFTGPRSVFTQVGREAIAFPASLTGIAPSESLFAISVATPRGRVLYRAGEMPEDGSFRATEALPRGASALRATLALRPAATRALAHGSLPERSESRLTLLFALSVALVIALLVIVHQDERFARQRAHVLSTVSHELRTPLAQIRVFAELLRLGRLRNAQERERSLFILDREAQRLQQMVDNVLLASDRDGARPRLHLVECELAPLVAEAVDAYRPLAASRAVTIALGPLADSVHVLVDEGAFRQILVNLLDNAVKYGPRDQCVRVSAWLHAPDRVRVAIDDEGPGIPRSQARRVWRAYHRLSRDRSGVGGMGLGLAVVRELVAALGGRARVETAPSGGARMIVELPVHAAAAGTEGDAPHAGDAGALTTVSS